MPFSIDATHLAATFDMEMSSFSLSLDLLTSSSVALRMPTASDVFLVAGEPAAALGLLVNSTAVPLPGGAWLLLSPTGVLGLGRRQVRSAALYKSLAIGLNIDRTEPNISTTWKDSRNIMA